MITKPALPQPANNSLKRKRDCLRLETWQLFMTIFQQLLSVLTDSNNSNLTFRRRLIFNSNFLWIEFFRLLKRCHSNSPFKHSTDIIHNTWQHKKLMSIIKTRYEWYIAMNGTSSESYLGLLNTKCLTQERLQRRAVYRCNKYWFIVNRAVFYFKAVKSIHIAQIYNKSYLKVFSNESRFKLYSLWLLLFIIIYRNPTKHLQQHKVTVAGGKKI